jgi:hypothetical protein
MNTCARLWNSRKSSSGSSEDPRFSRLVYKEGGQGTPGKERRPGT